MKLKVSFNHIYLVGYNSNRSSEHRVTERDGTNKPKTVRFVGNYVTEFPEVTYGTLVIDEDIWKKWFDGSKFLPGMETATSAAEVLVREPGVYYGCPVCSYKTKSRKDADIHVTEHINKFITQFDFEVEETNDKTVKK